MDEPQKGESSLFNLGKERSIALILGSFLFLTFFGLTQTATRLNITFHPPFTYSSPGEVYFWLAHALLLFPGACLIGYALSPLLSSHLRQVWVRVEGMSSREKIVALVVGFVLVTALARVLHSIVMLDFPFTDDEYATKFGGQVLAMGRLKVPAPQPLQAFPNLFLYVKDGMITSFDWPGVLAAWAIAEFTGLGPLVFALAAAVPVLCLMIILGKRFSPGYGLIAFAIFLFSPMAFTLSTTTHAHLLSRATISVALLFYFLAKDKQSWPLWILTGLATGISFCVRPIETTFLLFPLGVATVVPVFTKKTRAVRPVLGLLIGCLLPLALFFLYNFLITGDALFPPRFSAEGPAQTLMRGSLWNRFGANTSYNVFMLAIWFLGPLGILLIGFGLLADKFTRLLSLGVGAMLAAGLFHDNQGLHVVGPIHYSECVVPLTIIAVYGLVGIKEKLRRRKISFLIPASVLVCVLVLGLGFFNFWHCQALNRQALIQNYIYGFIENSLQEKKVDKALILAPQFGSLWVANDYFRSIGSWVFEWRRAKPDLSDKTLILHDLPKIEEKLKQQFSDRRFFRLRNSQQAPYFELIPL